ncbi:MAG: ATP-binding protein [Bifidobacteriaceae bacterium]|jgi:AAA+ superfamily predicted ATPase|nr:ATP-binding protein [Bifidobacteriaceae bacterium]
MAPKPRTLRLFDDLDAARTQKAVVALTGAGVSDILLLEDGRKTQILKALAAYAEQRGMQTVHYSQGWGVEYIMARGASDQKGEAPGRRLMNTDEQFAALIDHLRNSEAATLVILDWVDILLQDAGSVSDAQAVIIQRLAALPGDGLFRNHRHLMVMLVRNGQLNRRLSEFPGVVSVTLPIPDEEERHIAINQMVADPHNTLRLDPTFSPERAIRSSGGLYLDDLTRLRDLSATTPITEQLLVERKNAAIRRQGGDTLMVHDTAGYGPDRIAGMHGLKLALTDMESAGVRQPRILLAGPAGCGKSTAHRFVANHRGEPAVELDHVRERWVGASEERMDQAWQTVEALSPVCLFLDECEAELGRRSSTGGDESRTDSSLRSKMFNHLGDTGTQNNGSVIAATNRIDLMDEAAVDRFTVVPVIHPVGDECVEIMSIQAARSNRRLDFDSVKKAMAGAGTMSGRQLVRLLDRAAVHAGRRGSTVIEGADVANALAESMYRLSAGEVFQAMLAIRHTSFTPYLPWNAAAARGQERRWPDYMDGLVNPDGSLWLDQLDAKLDELVKAGAR